MSFKDIKGQDSAIAALKGAIKNKRIAHAYLFLGPSGVGKKTTAINFAKALNCENPVSEEPCDRCAPCRKIDSFVHPDVLIFKPQGDGSSIKIEHIREIIKDINLKPFEAKRKVYIIDNAKNLTQEASNALLKTLEEPPTDSVVILIAEQKGDLFRTILSRSQVVRFSALKAEEVKDILIKIHSVDEAKAHILSRLSSGRLGEALRYGDSDLFSRRSILIDGFSKKRFLDFDFEKASREDLRFCLSVMLSWFRDILVAKSGSDYAFINIDRKDEILNEAKRLDFDYLDDAIRKILSTSSFLDQNANPKLAMSVLGLQIFAGPATRYPLRSSALARGSSAQLNMATGSYRPKYYMLACAVLRATSCHPQKFSNC